jgi:hypothetical protein
LLDEVAQQKLNKLELVAQLVRLDLVSRNSRRYLSLYIIEVSSDPKRYNAVAGYFCRV